MSMRVGIIALLQESNTFVSEKTHRRHFEEDILDFGDDVLRTFADAHHEVGGFLEGLRETSIEIVPIMAARAVPHGPLTTETYEWLLDQMMSRLERAGSLDGLLLAAHGATVCESVPDVDGDWLTRVREFVGADCPVIATLDPHGNVSAKMVQATDALVAYQTNPHLDQRQRGIHAAEILVRTLHGECQPTQAAAFPPMAINIEKQLTEQAPCQTIFAQARDIAERGDVLSSSIILGFPYADVAEMGSSAIVVTDGDPALADQLAKKLGESLWSSREEFVGEFLSPEDAVKKALQSPQPVCLLDMGDNAGGGSPADGTILAELLHEQQIADGFICLFDPDAVAQVEKAGVGQTLILSMGGKTDDQHGPPLVIPITALSIQDGRFTETQPRHGGATEFDQGRTAIVRTEHRSTIMLTTRRQPPFSLSQLTHFGIKPEEFRIIIAKGVHAPVAAYRDVCRTFLRVNTPGVTVADMRMLPYQNRRQPLFPFETDAAWNR